MLYLIGLGLNNEKDITVNGLEVVRRAERVYLEAYTAILMVGKEKLEAFYGRGIIIADRELVEGSADEILTGAATIDIAFLVVGDPLGATTHTDLILRARNLQIPTRTIHNASILTAIASTGLQLYSFGQTLSMVFFTPTWRPTSWYDRLQENWALGLHTLILLDIKVKEIDLHQLALRGSRRLIHLDDAATESQGIGEYAKPRFMTVSECALQMLDVARDIKADQEEGQGSTPTPTSCCSPNTLVVGVARLGTDSQSIVSGTLEQLSKIDLGEPLHSLVVVGRRCHELERDFVREFAVDKQSWDEVWQSGGYGTM